MTREGTPAAGGGECDKPVCAVKGDMFKMLKTVGRTASAHAASASATEHTASSSASREHAHHECPVDREELGRSTWTLLHTTAAHYPESPSAAHRVQARRFFDALGDVYPCSVCADDLRAEMRAEPPRVESRAALSQWVCRQHNAVNAKLGKDTFPCVLTTLDRRWRDGGAPCGGDEGTGAAPAP